MQLIPEYSLVNDDGKLAPPFTESFLEKSRGEPALALNGTFSGSAADAGLKGTGNDAQLQMPRLQWGNLPWGVDGGSGGEGEGIKSCLTFPYTFSAFCRMVKAMLAVRLHKPCAPTRVSRRSHSGRFASSPHEIRPRGQTRGSASRTGGRRIAHAQQPAKKEGERRRGDFVTLRESMLRDEEQGDR